MGFGTKEIRNYCISAVTAQGAPTNTGAYSLGLPFANFSSNVTEGYAPLSVQFTGLTENATEWYWDFGDETNSTEENPIHIYDTVGNYTVNLTAINLNGTDSKLATITVLQPAPSANTAQYAYITNFESNTVSVIDISTNNVSATVPVGAGPVGVTVNGRSIYVTNYWNSSVSVINATTNKVTNIVKVGTYPYGIAVNPAGTKIYVANYWSNTISIIDTATKNLTNTVKVGCNPRGIVVSHDGTKLYMTNQYSNDAYVFDLTTNNVTAIIGVGSYPWSVAVNPDGKEVYMTNINSNEVSVIDAATDTVTATVPVGAYPYGAAVTPDGKQVYVTNTNSKNISVIDTATNNVTDTIKLETSPYGIAVSPDGKKVYVANQFSKNVSVIDTTTKKVIHTIEVGYNPISFGQFIGTFQVQPINPIEARPIYPVANFSANVTSGSAPLSIQFTDLSENTTEWSWDFENDRIIDSSLQNPVHLYTSPGTYTVNLTATNQNGTDSKTATITVFKTIPIITWNNPANITYGIALNSTQLNAVASVPGTFIYTPPEGTVLDLGIQRLHADFIPTDTANYTNASKNVTINVLKRPIPPVANFSATPIKGKAPLTVTFTDESTGQPTSWVWNFGDKNISTAQNPVHTYSKVGKYTVNLKVENAAGNSTKNLSNYIVVKK